MSKLFKGVACSFALVVGFYGCGSDDTSDALGSGGAAGNAGSSGSSGSGGSGGGAIGGASGTGNSAGTGGSGGGSSDASLGGSGGGVGDSGLPDVTFSYDGPTSSDGSVSQDSACAATTVQADPLDLDMYLMLDRSGSMDPDCNIGSATSSKWCYAINALNGFFNAPSSIGMGVALQYFPITNYSCSGNGGACATPAVPLGILPSNVSTLQTSLNVTVPSGSNTPIEAGLRGLIDYTAKNKQTGRVMIGVLITDGVPNACSTSGSTMQTLVANHFAATGIRTFVIGMTGASFTLLETIASGGGGPQHPDTVGSVTDACGNGGGPCYHWNVGNGNPQAFIAALQAIQASAVACTFAMPKPTQGVVDPNKVTIEYTPGGGGTPQTLPKVSNATQCGTNEGWYYDNNVNPTTINLCPATCTKVQNDSNGKIDVLLGCLSS